MIPSIINPLSNNLLAQSLAGDQRPGLTNPAQYGMQKMAG
jgi:hypothetical protein